MVAGKMLRVILQIKVGVPVIIICGSEGENPLVRLWIVKIQNIIMPLNHRIIVAHSTEDGLRREGKLRRLFRHRKFSTMAAIAVVGILQNLIRYERERRANREGIHEQLTGGTDWSKGSDRIPRL